MWKQAGGAVFLELSATSLPYLSGGLTNPAERPYQSYYVCSGRYVSQIGVQASTE